MQIAKRAALGAALLLVLGVLVWQGIAVSGNPDPLSARAGW